MESKTQEMLSKAQKWRKRARTRYRKVARWEDTNARRIPADVQRAVLKKFESEGRLCDICGEVVAEGEIVSIDHIIPWRYGGPSTSENLRGTHAICNYSHAGEHRPEAEDMEGDGDSDD
jgi:5-methylcytosine-specific restriction endonuclease McrA